MRCRGALLVVYLITAVREVVCLPLGVARVPALLFIMVASTPVMMAARTVAIVVVVLAWAFPSAGEKKIDGARGPVGSSCGNVQRGGFAVAARKRALHALIKAGPGAGVV